MNQVRKSTNRDLTKGWSQRLASGWMLFGSSTFIGIIAGTIILVALGNTSSAWFLFGTVLLSSMMMPGLILGLGYVLDR